MSKIEDFLQREIDNLRFRPEVEEIGEVLEVKDGIVKSSGLTKGENLEIVKFDDEKKSEGLILSLEEETVGIVVLGDYSSIKEGNIVKRTRKILSLPVGEEMVGRVINPLGQPLDGKGKIKGTTFYPLEKIGPSVAEREPVSRPLHTGIKAIDALIPIGRGQRELILGDKITKKTETVLNIILNQKEEKERPICIYVAIGKREAEIARIKEMLEKKGAMEYTILVVASSADPASFQYLAPYAGAAQGEYFMDKGKNALVIFDDLTKHAWAWRQISLILRRPPGREAYPGDIFYLHSRLLERAAKLNEKRGGGSLTALPIIETQAGDYTTYIPTNVISICDGQIIMDTSLYLRGQRPEVNIGLSVSRVGSAAQTRAMKKVASRLKLDLAQFQELERFLEFSEEVDEETKKKLERGKRMREILKQEYLSPLPFEKETVIIFAGVRGFLDKVPLSKIKEFENNLFETIEVESPEIFQSIKEKEDLLPEIEEKLTQIISNLVESYATEGNQTEN